MAKKVRVKRISEQLYRLIDVLLNLGMLELGEFELKHHEIRPMAERSPSKINLRAREYGGPLVPDAIKAIAAEMFKLIQKKKIKFDLVAGVPQAGEPFAEEIARLSGKRLLKLKKETSGGGRKITGVEQGTFSFGQIVLLIDDVITFGGSKKEAILALRIAGLTVFDLIVFIDREQGGVRELKEKLDCKTHAVLPQSTVLERAVAIGRISGQDEYEITKYVRSNQAAC